MLGRSTSYIYILAYAQSQLREPSYCTPSPHALTARPHRTPSPHPLTAPPHRTPAASGQSQLKDRSAWFVRESLEREWRCNCSTLKVPSLVPTDSSSCRCGATAADHVRSFFGFDFPIPVDPDCFPTAAKVGKQVTK